MTVTNANRCPDCPAAKGHDCPGEHAARLCELARSRPAYRESIRRHAAGFALPSIEESERIIARAQEAMAAGAGKGKGIGCCG